MEKDKTFYSPEEVIIAHNEGELDLHAHIKVRWTGMIDGETKTEIIETTRAEEYCSMKLVPNEVGFINDLLTKKALKRYHWRNSQRKLVWPERLSSWMTSRTLGIWLLLEEDCHST